MNHWLVKSEPDSYSWDRLKKEGHAVWDGVRNFQARNNLRDMKAGDLVLFYHSNEGKEVVGIARVIKESFQDPTTAETQWLAVELAPLEGLKYPVKLEKIKADPRLQQISLVKQGRLSVMPLKREEFDRIVQLGSNRE